MSAVVASKPADDLAREARACLEQADFSGACRLVHEALDGVELDPSYAEALYVLAVAERCQRQFDKALTSLAKVLALNPGHARAYQEKGHAYLALNQPELAMAGFEHAVRANAALPASWQTLIGLYDRSGMSREAAAAKEQLEFLTQLPKELLAVTSMINENRLVKADRLCRHFLQQNKHHIEGMRLLAAIGVRAEVLADAEFLLESCVELAPDYDLARYDYANLLLKMQKFENAWQQTSLLMERQPGNLAYKALHANAAAGIGKQEKAIKLYDEVLEQSPNQIMLYSMRGHAQKTIGHVDQALQSYQAAYKLKADYGDAYWSLANVKTYRFTEDEIRQMKEQEAAPTTEIDDRIHLCFALGKAFEDRSDFEQSFTFYGRGNALKHESIRHKPEYLAIRTLAQIEVCTREFFASKQAVGYPAPDPIFIVGLPRAGSTLLEQILASHSKVDGTHELPNIIALAQRLRGSRNLVEDKDDTPNYPKILTELDEDYFRRFGEQFIEDTRVYREGAAHFIDKNPNNFFHVGLIKLILPNAKVIDARRHPMSCCFSGFKQLFGQGQEFSYGLEEIGNYYREYVELMNHWDEALPGFVLRVQHEDVIDDLETQIRRILDFCGLTFEEACLEFYNTKRNVRTPSSEQVRQPIYRSGLDYWRNYEPWLAPLKEALGPDMRRQFSIDY